MTSEEFRMLALGLDGVTERQHQAHPDFRAHGKVFATLHWPDSSWAMVKLPPDEQKRLTTVQPDVFVPVRGRWGENGCTNVRLSTAKPELAQHALEMAWQNCLVAASRKRK